MLDYCDSVIPPLHFQFCLLCASELTRRVLFEDGINRVTCAQCNLTQMLSNVVNVVSVADDERGIVAIIWPYLCSQS